MLPIDQDKVDLLGTTFALPVFAIFVMAGVESLVDTIGWRQRIVRLGWDLSVLGVGLVAGVFALPRLGGNKEAPLLGAISLLFSIGAGVAIMHLKKCPPERLTGLRAFLAFGCGLAALALPWYFVLTS
jgi:hypothetical protein